MNPRKKTKLQMILRDIGLALTPIVDTFLIYALTMLVGFLPFAWIFTHSKQLSYFAMPLLIGHLSLLFWIGKYLNYRKELREMRMMIQDDELFFSLYPFEKFLHDRKQRWAARREERASAKAKKRQEKELARRGL